MKNKNITYIIIITIVLLFIFLIYLTYNDDKNIEKFGIIDIQKHRENLNKDIKTLNTYFRMNYKDESVNIKLDNITKIFYNLNNTMDIKYYIDLVIEIKNLEYYLSNNNKYKNKKNKNNSELHILLENITKDIENINQSFSDIKYKSMDLITTLYREINKDPETISTMQNNIKNIFGNTNLKDEYTKVINNKDIMSKYKNLLSDNPNNNNVSNFNNKIASNLSSVSSNITSINPL